MIEWHVVNDTHTKKNNTKKLVLTHSFVKERKKEYDNNKKTHTHQSQIMSNYSPD